MSFTHPPDTVPPGTVIPVNISVSNIPEGWVVCDGNNSTPDLRDKFIKSTKTASDTPGNVNGQDSVTLSTAQMPQHSHGGSTPDNPNAHSHSWTTSGLWNGGGGACCISIGGEPEGFDTVTTSTNGAHTHSDVSSNNSGSDGSFDNQPEYIEMLFIKKL